MTYEYFDAGNMSQSWIKNRIDAEFRKHKDLDWSLIASKRIIATIMDWCYENSFTTNEVIRIKELKEFLEGKNEK